MDSKKPPKCLNPKCERKQYARGLCQSCYGLARHIVKSGKTSWEELEKNGKTLKNNG